MSGTRTPNTQSSARRDPHESGLSENSLQPTLVRASAGTGKTYQLTARLLRILLQGGSPESILATTFTRKAAGEILDRVLLTLAEAADPSQDHALEKLRRQVNIPTLPRSVCLQLTAQLMRNIHRLKICTLDSLFAQLARSFPFELGLPPAWRLTDEIEEVWLRERSVELLIASLDAAETETLLSMLGKGDVRRSVARELLGVVESAYSQSRQCDGEVWRKLNVPSRPDSRELTRIAGELRQAEVPQKSVAKKLQQTAERIEQRRFDLLVDDTLVANIATARRTRSEVRFGRSKLPESLDDAFDVLYAAARSEVLSLLRAQNEATGRVLETYDQHVTQLKESLRTLGFEDVSVRLAEQFAGLDAEALSSRMDGATDHLLLDEFQDTSPIQWQVLRPLAAQTAGAGDEQGEAMKSFFCVGDTKQAIYGWRGGVAEIFDAVADQLDGITEVEQSTSYRSSSVVLDTVNQVFQNLPRHPVADNTDVSDAAEKSMYEAVAVREFARKFPTHHAVKKDLPGFVSLETGRRVEGDAEARRMTLLQDAAKLAAGVHQQSPECSIGILTRTNRTVAQMIALLDSLGVEVSQEGGNPLTDSAAVEVVLSALMMVEHPADGRWRFHVAASPLAELLPLGPKDPPDSAANRLRRTLENRGLAETVELLASVLAPACDEGDTVRLRQLTQLAIQYQNDAAPRLRDFVRMVREKRVERPRAAPVRVMTVHQAKGLEFDAVLLPELDGPLTRVGGGCAAAVDQLGEAPKAMTRYLTSKAWHFLPRQWQRTLGDQAAGSMTEALCLLYVAMTRSRQALYMIMPPAKKSAFDNRTAASLVYHALGCEEDPTQDSITLFQAGDPKWYKRNC